MSTSRITVVCATAYERPEEVGAYLAALPAHSTILCPYQSGLAELVAARAQSRGLAVELYLPAWYEGRACTTERDLRLVARCDAVVVFDTTPGAPECEAVVRIATHVGKRLDVRHAAPAQAER